jgi:hypothetical protein
MIKMRLVMVLIRKILISVTKKRRINTEYNILGGITQAEMISFCLLLSGLLGCIVLYKNKRVTQ